MDAEPRAEAQAPAGGPRKTPAASARPGRMAKDASRAGARKTPVPPEARAADRAGDLVAFPAGDLKPFEDDAGGRRMPLWERPGFLVRRLHQIHSAMFLEECKAFNITPVQYGLMTTLLQHSGSDQRTIGVEVGLDRTNVADVLERLAERGLVRRARSEKDRRSMNAYLTEEGRALVDQMYGSMVRAQERLLEPLDPEFRPAFLAMLSQLVDGNNHYSRAELKADFKVGRRRRQSDD
ncbi:MarR family transcriptional regulator [Xanthobacter sp. KR7-65]|uniref:MarR family winged helix-turn-helix transcriptional regulator n=1 Tax=Xanthobacter sp. KR7-65 TaxID=3156612 RepID=UPI0032B357F2